MGPWHPEGTHRPEVPRGRSGQRGWRAWGPLSRGLCTAAEPTVTVSSALRPRGQQLRWSLEVQSRSPETRGCGNAAPPPHPLPLRQAGSSVASRDGEGRAGKDSSPGGPGPNTTRSTFKEGASSCGRSQGRPRIRHSTAQGRGDQDRRPGEQGPERGPREGVCSGEKDRGGHRRAWGPLAGVAVPWCVRVWPFLSRPRSAHDLCWLRPLHRLQGLHGQLSTGGGGRPRAAWANPASPSSPW